MVSTDFVSCLLNLFISFYTPINVLRSETHSTDFDTLISGPEFPVDHFRGCNKLYYTNKIVIAINIDVQNDKKLSPLVDGLMVTPAGESAGPLGRTRGLG